jgi:hypothetical protein
LSLVADSVFREKTVDFLGSEAAVVYLNGPIPAKFTNTVLSENSVETSFPSWSAAAIIVEAYGDAPILEISNCTVSSNKDMGGVDGRDFRSELPS